MYKAVYWVLQLQFLVVTNLYLYARKCHLERE